MNTILFDMDGTLFDTEKHYQWAWRKAIADAGYELDASEVLKLRSLGAPYNVAQFQEWFGTPRPPSRSTARLSLSTWRTSTARRSSS